MSYLHIIGKPWEALNCQGAAREVFKAHGIELPEDAFRAAEPGIWERIGSVWRDATRVLDVIVSDPTGKGFESHVSVLVAEKPKPCAITSSVVSGVAYVKPWAIRRVLGVYRLRGDRV